MLATSETEKMLPAKTATFPHSTGRRRGTAVSDDRIIPVPYSPPISSTPSTPNATTAKVTPFRLVVTGLKAAFSAQLKVSRVSALGGGTVAGPGVAVDLIKVCLAWLDGGKSGLEELAAELAEHVRDGRAGLGAVPRAQTAPPVDVGGVVGAAGVPQDQKGLDEESE